MLPVISDPESLTTTGADAVDASRPDLLADRRLLAILRYLDGRDEPVPLAELADHLVLEGPIDDAGALATCGDALVGTRRRVLLSLRHSHVPRLADAGTVTFDVGANAVSLRESGAELLERAADAGLAPSAD